jgi:diaminohydroxyphosphoribosylaminopyrimidine deaminase/5-amino-6-(5-phosphoribosylamino)uracil reductase
VKDSDRLFLLATIELAKKGLMTVAPNPPVGCLILKNGCIIGSGYHEKAGEGHAEINALSSVSETPEGATVYVSLEPCAHQGKTPPCVSALIDARVRRVVVGHLDPNPLVSGKGVALLRDAGIEVETENMPEALRLIESFQTRMTKKRPFVRIKTASSLDGAISMASGESKWITGEEARSDVQYWRARSDAIISGVGSVLHDNPRLTLRKADYDGVKQPIRVILDSRLRTPRTANVLTDGAPTLVVSDCGLECFGSLSPSALEELAGIELDGPRDLENLLKVLASLGCNDVLVEAGPKVVSSFLKGNCWDEWISYVAPKLLGKESRRLTDLDIVSIQDSVSAQVSERKMIGSDLRLILRPT